MSTSSSRVLAEHGSQKGRTRGVGGFQRARTPQRQNYRQFDTFVETCHGDPGEVETTWGVARSAYCKLRFVGYRGKCVLVRPKECSIHQRRPWQAIQRQALEKEGGTDKVENEGDSIMFTFKVTT